MKYEEIIREQNQSLNEMHNYILLCEERIRQLSPEHEFPITEKHLSNVEEVLQLHFLKEENKNLKNLCAQKDKVT